MRRRLYRLLISTAFLTGIALGASPAVFADSANSNGGNSTTAHTNTTKNNDNYGQANKSSQPSQSTQATTTTSTSTSPGNSNHSQGNASTTGVFNQPQPYSTADQNNTGANDTSSTNQYKSTRNGSPSLNGNGNGQATGKPCAGCVGKADNKNPKGQYPNGSDHNNGYECDGNHGIGRSNPAHTGCVGGSVGCTSGCGQVCLTNCSHQNACTTKCDVGGRGGGVVLGASTVAAATSHALPNTGLHESANWWAAFAVISFLVAAIYWRGLVMPLLIKR